jgi:hypothetical protein
MSAECRPSTGASENDLPAEMVEEIIKDMVLSEHLWRDMANNRKAAAAVNRRWNAITYSTRQLWNPLTVHIWMNAVFADLSAKRLVNGPVNLHIDGHTGARYKYRQVGGTRATERPGLASFGDKLFPQLLQVMDVVRELQVTAYDLTRLQYIMRMLAQYKVPAVRTVRYCVDSETDAPFLTGPMEYPSTGGTASMSLEVVPPGMLPLSEFSALTDLRLYCQGSLNTNWATLKAIFETTVHLVTLHLLAVECRGMERAAVLTLPAVQNVHFSFRYSTSIVLLSKLAFPSIIDLDIRAFPNADVRRLVECGRLFEDAVTVRFHVGVAQMDAMDAILPMMQGARSLDLTGCGSDIIPIVVDLARRRKLCGRQLQQLKVRGSIDQYQADTILHNTRGVLILSTEPLVTHAYCGERSGAGGHDEVHIITTLDDRYIG